MNSTVETGIGREVTPNFHPFVDETKPMQRVSTQLKSVEIVGRRGLVNFSDVQIVIVGTTDVIGTRHLVQSEAGAFVSPMSGGNQHRVTQGVTQEDGVGLVIDLGTLRPLASPAIPAQTEMIGHSALTHESGRRNRFALIVTGTQEQKRVVWLGMKNTTLYRSMRTLPRPKKRRSRRNRS